jgi:hypothetical protein
LENYLLDWLRDKKNGNDNRFLHYIYNNIEDLFLFNFKVLAWLLSSLNGFSEWLVVLFGPIIFLFFACITIGCSSIYYIFLVIYTPFSIFLKKKADLSDLESNLPNGITWDTLPDNYKWKDLCGWDWWIGLGFAFFTLLFILVFFAISTPLSTIILIWCLVTIFSYVGYKETGEEKEKITVSNVIGETYGQYKRLMAFIITILVISSVFSNIGTITGITSILVIISIYFGWIPITIFQKFDYTNLDTYKEIKQPVKECLISNKGLDKLKYKQPGDCSLFGNKSILDLDLTPYLTTSKTGNVAKGPDVAKKSNFYY